MKKHVFFVVISFATIIAYSQLSAGRNSSDYDAVYAMNPSDEIPEMTDHYRFKRIPEKMKPNQAHKITPYKRGDFQVMHALSSNSDVVAVDPQHESTETIQLRGKKPGQATITLYGKTEDGVQKRASKVITVR